MSTIEIYGCKLLSIDVYTSLDSIVLKIANGPNKIFTEK